MSARILVVDDEPDIQKVVTARLKAVGYFCLTANDGYEGFFKAHSEKPDLILLDVAMPRASGATVCKLLKSSPDKSIASIPIILLTAGSAEVNADNSKSLGADQYISKPFKLEELLGEVQKHLSVK